MVTQPTPPKTFVFPTTESQVVQTLATATPATHEIHAGGTDVIDRLRHGQTNVETLVHLRNYPEQRSVRKEKGLFTLGALATLDAVANDRDLQSIARVLTEAATHTATPQIRHRATIGGALFQRPRCAYFREAAFSCLKTGGDRCLAREGDHHSHAIFQNQVCMAPHPSTLACALMALEASVTIAGANAKAPAQTRSLESAFAIDVNDPTVEHALGQNAFVTEVTFPARVSHQGQAYRRASARRLADWADVEVAAVLDIVAGSVSSARIVLGGVGRTPIRATAAEQVLLGKTFNSRTIKKAAEAATTGATPLEQNRWKVDMTQGLVEATLEAIHLGPTTAEAAQ